MRSSVSGSPRILRVSGLLLSGLSDFKALQGEGSKNEAAPGLTGMLGAGAAERRSTHNGPPVATPTLFTRVTRSYYEGLKKHSSWALTPPAAL